MKVVMHLSDLHFGRVDRAKLDPLASAAQSIHPDVVVVSGDLTQRARRVEFREARDFLARLPKPQVVVPGNHDVPLYNVLFRFVRPLETFQRYISEDLEPFHQDDEIAVIGLNTARSLTFKRGRINERQIARARDRLCALPDNLVRVIVTHHPFDLPEGGLDADLVGRARMAMEMFVECGADVILSGHLHVFHTGHTAIRYKLPGRSALVVQAGTATSTRERGEPNSFNVLSLEPSRITLERRIWQRGEGAFLPAAVEAFERTNEGWERASPRDTRVQNGV
ncbi:MAG: metallophosphatase [Acidobacteria bacterium]|nr:MAG: metallophosphatase [Acidobacteriota bacterium]